MIGRAVRKPRLAVWSPLPPSPSGIADYVAEALPALARQGEVVAVVTDPDAVAADLRALLPVVRPAAAAADLDLYHIGNSPAHAYVYRAALERPGVVVLHEWNLHHLVLSETVERADSAAYLRQMRLAYGEVGSLVGRQVSRALGGEMFPALFPLNDAVLERSLAVVGLTDYVSARARRVLAGRPVLHLAHHLALPFDPIPTRRDVRRQLGLAQDALVVTAPGLATANKRWESVLRVTGRLRRRHPRLRLVLAGAEDPRLPLENWARQYGMEAAFLRTGRLSLEHFAAHLAAADIVLALRFPTYGEISGALVRALGIGRATLVSDGTPAAEEFPAGVVAAVDPGAYEDAELAGLLDRLAGDAALREAMGARAAEHTRSHHALTRTVEQLWTFLDAVATRKSELLHETETLRVPETGLLRYLVDELRWHARELGLATHPFVPLLAELAERTA